MSFRDDREAAHQRANALEEELRQAQEEVARLKGPRRRRRGAAVAGVALAAAGFAGAGAVFWMLQRSAAQASVEQAERELAAGRAAEEAARAAAEQERAAAEARLAAVQAAAQSAAAPAQEPVSPTVRVVWRASVDEAVGVALPSGTPCTLEGAFARFRDDVVARELTITCGAEVLYRTSPDAAPSVDVSLREGPVLGSSAHVHLLRYRDERAEQPTKATVSTLGHTASVWRDGASPLRVTLFVHDTSEPREGVSLGGRRGAVRGPSFAEPVERAGRVTAARGHAPAAVGAQCAFAVRPVWEFPENCRLALRCGTTWIYGAREAGYLTCEVRDGRPVAALDENTTDHGGDPRVTWRGRRVVVSDFTEAGEWSLDVTF